MFEPAQLPQETIGPSVAFIKGHIQAIAGDGEVIIALTLSLSYPIKLIVFLLPKENSKVSNS